MDEILFEFIQLKFVDLAWRMINVKWQGMGIRLREDCELKSYTLTVECKLFNNLPFVSIIYIIKLKIYDDENDD